MGTFSVRILKSYRTQKDTRKSDMPSIHHNFSMFICVCVRMCLPWCTCGARGQPVGVGSPSIVWVMGVELTLPALATSPLLTELYIFLRTA